MTKNKINYPITNTVKRIFRAFEENGDKLSTNEIYTIMQNQIQLRGGRVYSKNPTKGTLAQILNKYPYFRKVGHVDEASIQGFRVRLCVWELNEVNINESTSHN